MRNTKQLQMEVKCRGVIGFKKEEKRNFSWESEVRIPCLDKSLQHLQFLLLPEFSSFKF